MIVSPTSIARPVLRPALVPMLFLVAYSVVLTAPFSGFGYTWLGIEALPMSLLASAGGIIVLSRVCDTTTVPFALQREMGVVLAEARRGGVLTDAGLFELDRLLSELANAQGGDIPPLAVEVDARAVDPVMCTFSASSGKTRQDVVKGDTSSRTTAVFEHPCWARGANWAAVSSGR